MTTRRFLALASLVSLSLVQAGCGNSLSEEEASATLHPLGLRTKDLQEGKDGPVKAGDVVEVNYKGYLKADGKKVESTEGKDPKRITLGARGIASKVWTRAWKA